MKFELPQLPYEMNALQPVVSERTMEFHFGKHLATYISNVNTLIKGSRFQDMELEDIVKQSEGALYNNAAQAWNHTFFFYSLAPYGNTGPKGKLKKEIEKTWGSVDNFKKDFVEAGLSVFGSGWVFLVANATKGLEIMKAPNAGCPLTEDKKPLLAFDVWEHSYYLDYQNRRADALKELWNVVNWDMVGARYI